MIRTGIIMDFVCGTVGELDSVKRNLPSYLWLPWGQLYLIVWFSKKKDGQEFVFYLDITPSHAFLWSKAWLEIKGVSGNSLMKSLGKSHDFNPLERYYWTFQKRKVILFQIQFLTKTTFEKLKIRLSSLLPLLKWTYDWLYGLLTRQSLNKEMGE